MQIRKKWLNQLKNCFNKHINESYLHLFAGESHQVVKITVPYCPVIPRCPNANITMYANLHCFHAQYLPYGLNEVF